MKFRILFTLIIVGTSLWAMEQSYQQEDSSIQSDNSIDWLFSAGDDMEAADALMCGKKQFPSQALNFTLLSAEKILKAYLISQENAFNKTHNLEELLNQCTESNVDFASFDDFVKNLNKYTKTTRYPIKGDSAKPDLNEVRKHIHNLRSLYHFITELLVTDEPVPNMDSRERFLGAVKEDNTWAAEHLIKAGINVDSTNANGETALFVAIELYSRRRWKDFAEKCAGKKTVKLLLQNGADVNVQNRDGDTPLILAARLHLPKFVKLLLCYGGDANIQNKKGETALSVAKVASIKEFLEPRGNRHYTIYEERICIMYND